MRADIREVGLEGETLPSNIVDMGVISHYGNRLYQDNAPLIRKEIPGDWFAVIEPVSGTLIASLSLDDLCHYTIKKYKGRLFYVLGLMRKKYIC